MDAKRFYDELNAKLRSTRPNQQSHIFARRALNAIIAAYDLYEESSEFGKVRRSATTEQIEKANALIEMGVEKAIYSNGRSLLRY